MKSKLFQYYNCRILRNHQLVREDLWVRDGLIQDPMPIFFEEKVQPDCRINCHNLIISPGFIDIQLNGGFEIDFSSNTDDVEAGLNKVAKGILKHGVTSFCPTVVSSPDEIYHEILPKMHKNEAKDKAGILGIHLEGPFISKEKRGAHLARNIKHLDDGFDTLIKTYGSLENVSIITLAPETANCMPVIKELSKRGIKVSLGHSVANLIEAEKAVNSGASLITHLFNAMHPFHHRDPGLVGLLTSKKIINHKQIYYGIISDGIHTHPAALRIAYRTNPKGIILITDAISAMGLAQGTYKLGQQRVKINGFTARLEESNILAGSVATMTHCIKHFRKATHCTMEEALEAASLHPAECLGLQNRKGTLNYGSDADYVLLDDELNVHATFIAGKAVYTSPDLLAKNIKLCDDVTF